MISIASIRDITWHHIANAISHELYPSLSNTLMVIINRHKFHNDDIHDEERVQQVLQQLKKSNIHQKEIEYISALIERAVNSEMFLSKSKPLERLISGMFIAYFYVLCILIVCRLICVY